MTRQFRYLGEFINGPYDGVSISGWTLPVTVTVDLGLIRVILNGEQWPPAPNIRRYDHVADWVNIDNQWVDVDDLIESERLDLLDKADQVKDLDGDPIVLVRRLYQWTPGEEANNK